MTLSRMRVLTSGRILLALEEEEEEEEEEEPRVRTLKRSLVLAPAVRQTTIRMQKIHQEMRRTRTEDDKVDWDDPWDKDARRGEDKHEEVRESSMIGGNDRETERDRKRERKTEREGDRERGKQKEKRTEGEGGRVRGRQREREAERKKTEREGDRERGRQRERETATQKETADIRDLD